MVYDLIVIGGGPAGYLGAIRAGEAGLATLLIERRALGGVCLNEGCIPSKTLLNSAKLYDYARFSEKYGVTTEGAHLDHGKVVKRKEKVVRTLVVGVKMQLRQAGVTTIEGAGYIQGKDGQSFKVNVGDSVYRGKNLLIATGSEAVIPPIEGIEVALRDEQVLTSREIFDLKEVPDSFVVVGGGVVGLEMGSYFNSVGSKVTVIEMLDHIAGETDRDISNILMKNYEKKGVEFLLSSRVMAIDKGKLIYEKDGETFELEADKVLMSVGRRPSIQEIGLENIGVQVDDGAIVVDEHGRTNIPKVYAAGDVNGYSMLAHTAYREAEVCINNILGNDDRISYDTISSVIYTNPEVAMVGETEKSATEKGIEYDIVKLPMQYSGRYVAENERGDGICKILVEKKSKGLIGVHMIGSYVSEIIYGAATMMEAGMGIDDIKKIVFPHPTVSEILREGIFRI